MTENDHWDEENEIAERDRIVKEAINALPPMYKRYMIERFLNHKSKVLLSNGFDRRGASG